MTEPREVSSRIELGAGEPAPVLCEKGGAERVSLRWPCCQRTEVRFRLRPNCQTQDRLSQNLTLPDPTLPYQTLLSQILPNVGNVQSIHIAVRGVPRDTPGGTRKVPPVGNFGLPPGISLEAPPRGRPLGISLGIPQAIPGVSGGRPWRRPTQKPPEPRRGCPLVIS